MLSGYPTGAIGKVHASGAVVAAILATVGAAARWAFVSP